MLTTDLLQDEIRILLSLTPEQLPNVTIGTFTRRAEQWFNRGGVIDGHRSPPLRVINLQKSFAIVSEESAGEGDIPFQVRGNICYFDLPDDFLEIVSLWSEGDTEPMAYHPEDQFRSLVYGGAYRDMFTLVGNQVFLSSSLYSNPKFRITYYAKIPPLADGNWLADEYEQVYIDAVMAQYYSARQDNENKVRRFASMSKSIMQLNERFGRMSVIKVGRVSPPFVAANSW